MNRIELTSPFNPPALRGRAFVAAVFLALLAPLGLVSQQAPVARKLEFENAHIRIERLTIPVGHTVEMHSHAHASVEIFLTDAHVRKSLADGTSRDWRAKGGEVVCNEPETHRVEHLHTAPTVILTIEFKGVPLTKCPKRDEHGAADSAIEFEDDRLWITRSKIGPWQKGPEHTHPESVGIFLTDAKLRAHISDGTVRELSGKRGDVSWRAPVTHSIENLADSPFEAIDVNLKTTPAKPAKP